MTKELLEQYLDICGELYDLDRLVTDTVSGCLPEPPYTRHTISVRGIPYTARRAKLERQKVEIEDFVEGIPSAGLRRIVTYRALQGLSWKDVAAKMGRKYSEAGTKMKYYRFIEKI